MCIRDSRHPSYRRAQPARSRPSARTEPTARQPAGPGEDMTIDEMRERLRAALSAAGDPERARAQQAYMKSEMPYYGVSPPELTALLRPLLAEFKPASRGVWEETVRALWDGATHREERYAAIAFAQHR